MRNTVCIAMLCLMAMAVACGSDDGPTKSSSGGKRDGKVFVINASDLVLQVTVKYGDNIVEEMEVGAHSSRTAVSDIIEGDMDVTVVLDVVRHGEGDRLGFVQGDPHTKEFSMDGDVTIEMTASNYSGDQWTAVYEFV